jgi:hypothetical protein
MHNAGSIQPASFNDWNTIFMNAKLPSNKKFGLLFTGVFFALALYGYIRHGYSIAVISFFFISLFFLIASFLDLHLLTPLNRAWLLLGHALGKVVSPIILGIIFFGLLTPIALISRLSGRDELKLRRPRSKTYWVKPVGSNVDSESFKNQF